MVYLAKDNNDNNWVSHFFSKNTQKERKKKGGE